MLKKERKIEIIGWRKKKEKKGKKEDVFKRRKEYFKQDEERIKIDR